MTQAELVEALAPLLEELRALRRVFEAEARDPEPVTGCAHPEATRRNLTSVSGPIEWVCGVEGCGYHHLEARE